MFNFLHPRSVLPRRPVAEHAVKQSARRPALPEVLVVKQAAPGLEAPEAADAAPEQLARPEPWVVDKGRHRTG